MKYCLIYWPEEDCTSVVSCHDVVEPQDLKIKVPCKVKVGKEVYTGVIAEIG